MLVPQQGGACVVKQGTPPLRRLPWVFTYNEWSEGPQYIEMAKAAVKSGVEVGGLKPFCMYSGQRTSAMHRWLLEQGVIIIEVGWRAVMCMHGTAQRALCLPHRPRGAQIARSTCQPGASASLPWSTRTGNNMQTCAATCSTQTRRCSAPFSALTCQSSPRWHSLRTCSTQVRGAEGGRMHMCACVGKSMLRPDPCARRL